MLTKYGAVLFTAPSGTGKSTQAELWRKHRGASIINGDCTLIAEDDGVFTAFGFPFSGTSGIFENRKAPIAAVVYLRNLNIFAIWYTSLWNCTETNLI